MVPLTPEDKQTLLRVARESITLFVRNGKLLEINLEEYSPALCEPGATFVTLTIDGALRGCIGALEAYQPLVEDVREHAVAASRDDFRFLPVPPRELVSLRIEISRLTPPERLIYGTPDELPGRLRPGIDGVILRDNFRRATYLPQVWDKIPDTEEFLSSLCQKMGAPANLWRRKMLEAAIYQVEEFAEAEPA